MNLFQFLIGISGITTASIFFAKFALKWIGEAGLEKYKNELQKETIIYQNILDKDLEAYKIRYNSLHLEQVEIIKKLYSKLIKAEKSLEYLMRPIKLNLGKSNEDISKDVVQYANDFIDYFDENEVVFNDDTCNLISLIKEKYINVWNTYDIKQIMGTSATGELLVQIADNMKAAYNNILHGEMQKLKRELKEDFRKRLGVIEEKNY